MENTVTLTDGARQFLACLSIEDRQAYSQEVSRFTLWYGGGKSFSDLVAYDVELYANELDSSTSNPALRAEALKAFLTYAKKRGWTASNLATMVKVRRAAGRKEIRVSHRQTKAVHLTAEGHEKIKGELDNLLKERPKIVDELQKARADKDFRENAPLDAARQRQAQVEGRIQQLEQTLKASVIIQNENVSDVKIGLGSKVVVRDLAYDEVVTYTLVSPNEVDLKKGKISVASPTGKALLDKQAGDEVDVSAPVGILKYRVERVEK